MLSKKLGDTRTSGRGLDEARDIEQSLHCNVTRTQPFMSFLLALGSLTTLRAPRPGPWGNLSCGVSGTMTFWCVFLGGAPWGETFVCT